MTTRPAVDSKTSNWQQDQQLAARPNSWQQDPTAGSKTQQLAARQQDQQLAARPAVDNKTNSWQQQEGQSSKVSKLGKLRFSGKSSKSRLVVKLAVSGKSSKLSKTRQAVQDKA